MRTGQLTLVLSSLLSLVFAGNVSKDGPCSTGNNRLQAGTFQFWSECNSVTFCSEQGLCVEKRCRRDDFPFGYEQGAELPPKCRSGEFCPDEGSDCQPLLPVDSPCQLNRDDQCEPPPNFRELADTTGFGLNYNGSVCLNNICMWANATLGNPCVTENIGYTAYKVNNDEFINVVSRYRIRFYSFHARLLMCLFSGNCAPGLYCESVSKTCLKNKVLGEKCDADKECETFNCQSSGVCGVAASTPRHFGAWVYVLVALGIIGGMGGTLTGLYYSHRKQRDIERAKRAQYWREQEQDITLDNSWTNDDNSDSHLRKGKGKERNTDSYINLESPDASTERFDASVYPPAHDELEETRRVEENLRRWEIAERQRRKAARESLNKGPTSPSVVSDVSRRTSLLWTKKRTKSSSNGGIKQTSSSSRDSIDFVPLTRVPTSPTSASPVPSLTPSDQEETSKDPFSNPPTESLSPFSDSYQIPSSTTSSTLLPNSDSSSSNRPPPPKPLNLPPPRTPPPIIPPTAEQVPTNTKPVKWWHEWLCGCGEGPDRGGDYQAGRTNPFE
ncbi:hypothetical protein CVT24_000170 [Panaeolus cyanescens]|uniref:Uncharacterized protein n=1 Tax=Panaeolus cyanescens TaxID=181874 RepID=A0A409VWS1_9AGAR|nr:hypothetical protein CVT24_000170 [Panaeolus cyanescens]